jgi:hypothetical protein
VIKVRRRARELQHVADESVIAGHDDPRVTFVPCASS